VGGDHGRRAGGKAGLRLDRLAREVARRSVPDQS
jgi:hypothetical protein